jgi:hypothetical protein
LKPLDEAKLGPKTYIVDFIHKLRGLNLIAIKEIDRLKGASGDLQIVEDYETLVSDKERSNIELKKVCGH